MSWPGVNGAERGQSDAFVFFGASGDLAYKKIFPALERMVRHGVLNVPVIGVAKSGWTLDDLEKACLRQRTAPWGSRSSRRSTGCCNCCAT